MRPMLQRSGAATVVNFFGASWLITTPAHVCGTQAYGYRQTIHVGQEYSRYKSIRFAFVFGGFMGFLGKAGAGNNANPGNSVPPTDLGLLATPMTTTAQRQIKGTPGLLLKPPKNSRESLTASMPVWPQPASSSAKKASRASTVRISVDQHVPVPASVLSSLRTRGAKKI